MINFDKLNHYIKNELFAYDSPILLHRPVFSGNEKQYLIDCIDSNFVSSVGQKVVDFENQILEYIGIDHAVAIVNGTSALHIAMQLVGVTHNTEVITQPVTFVATCNAISYCNASPVFVDVDKDTLGLSPEKLESFLKDNTKQTREGPVNKISGKRISACVPMHTFGHPCRIEEIADICKKYNLPLVEDAAESLGSYYKGKHTGSFGDIGIVSFNGNKIITAGGGGMLVTNNQDLAVKAKHITTTGKIPHPYEYYHEEVAYNYRLPNLNAALGCAQMEQLTGFLKEKRILADKYNDFFQDLDIQFIREPESCHSNYWLNAVLLANREERDLFLESTNKNGVMTRPIWALMNKLPMFSKCQTGDLSNAEWLEDRVVNIPSSIPTPKTK
ncbi:LegC family aminotransferase [Moritella sp. 24]|uniref:LegC family aminotransferase n=1 Tax=Moritella sp. 24 TaxID=2746230 RepID=UPI001BA68D8F|nr:LegC family aminotransferase [Moritella sp. 24]QUM75960.1 LegC family aminotransferase [Moritella sp. 24]